LFSSSCSARGSNERVMRIFIKYALYY
jgi:hypothetical protein